VSKISNISELFVFYCGFSNLLDLDWTSFRNTMMMYLINKRLFL